MEQLDDNPNNQFHQPMDFNPWVNDAPPEEAHGSQAWLASASEAGPLNRPGSPGKTEVATPAPSNAPAGQQNTGSSQQGEKYTGEKGRTRSKTKGSGKISTVQEKANSFLRQDLEGFLRFRWHELYRDGLFIKGKEEIHGLEALQLLKDAKTEKREHPLGTLRYTVALIRNFMDIVVEEKKGGVNILRKKHNTIAYDEYIRKYCPNADGATRDEVRNRCRYVRRWVTLIDGEGDDDDPDKAGLGTGVLLVCSDTLMNAM
ncbi:hypothetical protein BDV35DRAFT_141199 [Aspergillus flavus]|uniref:Uncharacterized protein n=1 Tax=Aspergillus flavus TaxID=5059 RepID=A0A5N6GDW3_ASPFL|nr:hypothetical protein BDV35DRAFT_141199 [Aspergillus flavus]GMG03971.1 unnamed protein product [Aspergillus oryzae]